jgi:hypothetical protein
MAAPPALAEISAPYPNPSNATARLGFAKLWNYITGLLGLTGNAAEARAALGMGTGVVLLRTTVYTRVGGVQMVSVDGGAPTATGATTFTKQAATAFADVEGNGAGGGSGGNPATSASQQVFSAGGGGGSFGIGRYSSGLTGVTVTVGLAGAAGAAGAAGGGGGATSFGALLTVPGGQASSAGNVAGAIGSVAGAPGGGLPTGANILAKAGGSSSQILSAALGFISSQAGGASGDGSTNSYGAGAPGKYNGVSTASPQPGIAAPFDGRLVVKEYA